MLVLLSAEVYTAVIMILGYFQTIRPLAAQAYSPAA